MNNITKNFQEQFLDEMLLEAGFEEEDFDLLKEDLRPLLQERIMLHIYRELTEDQHQTVGDLLKSAKDDELNKFLAENIPNFEDFLMEIYAQFEDEYLENMK